MKVLVTGGGGYIGSFMVKALCDRGDTVYVVDSFERGNRDVVDERATIFKGDLLDKDFIEKVLNDTPVDSVVHFAGLISVGESVKKPGLYFKSNVLGALNLLDAIKGKNIRLIFSSTAAVYGNPTTIPIPEDHNKAPTSPYGASKLMVEDILSWYHQIYGLSFTALRYFNASGAALDGSMGESHIPETHIIPCAIEALLQGKPFHLFGTDYNTPDGTCVRDYIHVLDLVNAHILCLDKMNDGEKNFFNVGTGIGHSNKEVLSMIEEVSGKKLEIVNEKRREGDPDELIADVSSIKQKLGFEPQHSDIKTIVESAYLWHSKKMENA